MTKAIENASLQNYTTMHVDCKARYLYSPESIEELQNFIKNETGKYVVIGKGSKVLFTKNWPGTVILLDKLKKIEEFNGNERGQEGVLNINCQAGLTISELLEFCIRMGYGGFEFMAGIPGTIGGSTVVNAGAYGKSIGDIVRNVNIIDGNGCRKIYKRSELQFKYRESNINGVVTDVTIRLERSIPLLIRNKIEEIILDRKKFPEDWSCGCIFKNPEGVSVGKLIEECGLKGYRIGDAEISKKHGNFIINHGNAKAMDILNLMNLMKISIKKRYNIDLIAEIRVIKE